MVDELDEEEAIFSFSVWMFDDCSEFDVDWIFGIVNLPNKSNCGIPSVCVRKSGGRLER